MLWEQGPDFRTLEPLTIVRATLLPGTDYL